MTILDKVREIVAETYRKPLADITPNTRFVQDLGDSMEVVEVVMTCEDVFDIAIPDADAEKLETVSQLVSYIESRLKPDETVWPPPPKGHF